MMLGRYLYTLLFNLLIPLLVLSLLWRSRKNPAYGQRIDERFGYVRSTRPYTRCIWLHAVSVGEVMAARPLLERLLKDFPDVALWVTTTTPTGSDTVKRLFGDRVQHSYCPYDLPDSLARFFRRVKPEMLLVMETEIWPNLYKACANRNIPLLLVNARLSARSYQGYARLGRLISDTLGLASWIGARSQQDADHFRQLGAKPEQVETCGNIKFDMQIPAGLDASAAALRQQWGKRPVWVAGSTHEGEDSAILHVYQRLQQQLPDLLLVLVPRHPERFATVRQLCVEAGFDTLTRSSGEPLKPSTQILLGDSMGELLLWYALADVAFIGGSLVPHGGHNPLEAAIWGVPVVSGKHTENFTDMFPGLYASGGAVQVDSATQLYDHTLNWLQDAAAREMAGQQAQAFAVSSQGAVNLVMQRIHLSLDQAQTHNVETPQTAGC
ncbi:MAG: lipid IV(A) 3-deoxy-D-manno-octulosonic acid transferase [Gammaproteobacteria bacterium]|nr:lipid IV(A) 3-deoxy-D-manno-octulosonic acid transferase [Gammaproteobacteria bacterium]MBU1724353.1 lipid IV(A) 3-deoxy-D-manno-octulosonic acid transferase [Gammaproteobacteria bacterium]MBU2006055.1 lipid IV(A) 3-deoxy-D-manno-octulosonic acid transferase [Gammaproteobacteria bacterium]